MLLKLRFEVENRPMLYLSTDEFPDVPLQGTEISCRLWNSEKPKEGDPITLVVCGPSESPIGRRVPELPVTLLGVDKPAKDEIHKRIGMSGWHMEIPMRM